MYKMLMTQRARIGWLGVLCAAVATAAGAPHTHPASAPTTQLAAAPTTQPATAQPAAPPPATPPRPSAAGSPAGPPETGVPTHQPAEAPWRNPRALWRALTTAPLALSETAIGWLAALALLVLLIQSRPLRSWHNADAAVLAAMALLWAGREATALAGDPAAMQAARWWTSLLLAAGFVYWAVRGVRLLLATQPPARQANLTTRALVVLTLAAAALITRDLTTSPLEGASVDGIYGARVILEHGHLPYGDVGGYDHRGPWLYAVHAGALWVVRLAGGQLGHGAAAVTADELLAARIVNGLLIALLLWGVWQLGRRLHSPTMGWTLVVALCALPATIDKLTDVETLLAGVLIVWATAAALWPGIGSLVSTALLVAAGFAWPWAFVLVPVLAAWWLRQRWHALGAIVGTAAAAAGCIAGLTLWVAPALPDPQGALRSAGLSPHYIATEAPQQTVIIEKLTEPPPAVQPADPLAPLWRWLLARDRLHLASASTRPALPSGVDRSRVLFRDIAAAGRARTMLQHDYRQAAAARPFAERLALAARTLLEATWNRPPAGRPVTGWYALLPDRGTSRAGLLLRYTAGALAVLLALLIALVMLGRPRPEATALFGGLLAATSAAVLAATGGIGGWMCWAPLALAATVATRAAAATEPVAAADSTVQAALRPVPPGPAPRITVER